MTEFEFPPCICHCLGQMRGPTGVAPVSDPGFPLVTFGNFRTTRVTVDQGKIVWDGDVVEKKYGCVIKNVIEETTIPATLLYEWYISFTVEYWRVMTATIVIFGFAITVPIGVGWTAPVTFFEAQHPRLEKDVLIDHGYDYCPDEGVAC